MSDFAGNLPAMFFTGKFTGKRAYKEGKCAQIEEIPSASIGKNGNWRYFAGKFTGKSLPVNLPTHLPVARSRKKGLIRQPPNWAHINILIRTMAYQLKSLCKQPKLDSCRFIDP